MHHFTAVLPAVSVSPAYQKSEAAAQQGFVNNKAVQIIEALKMEGLGEDTIAAIGHSITNRCVSNLQSRESLPGSTYRTITEFFVTQLDCGNVAGLLELFGKHTYRQVVVQDYEKLNLLVEKLNLPQTQHIARTFLDSGSIGQLEQMHTNNPQEFAYQVFQTIVHQKGYHYKFEEFLQGLAP